jgi:putative ABC transport system permease protein
MSTPPWSDIVRDRLLRLGEGRPDDTIVEELGLHLAQSYEEAREGGLDDEQAMSRALAMLDASDLLRRTLAARREPLNRRMAQWSQQETPLDSGGLFMSSLNLAGDIRYALRLLLRAPGFSAIAILTFAVGIGINTAVFNVVNGVLLRPLPYPDADRITLLWMDNRRQGIKEDITSYPNYLDWRDQSTSYAHMAAFTPGAVSLTGAGDPARVRAASVTANFFDVMGMAPIAGRVFTVENETPGRDAVVVLSHGLWQQLFAGAADVIGRSMQLNGRAYEVIGVMPQGLDGWPEKAELWRPLAPAEQLRAARNSFWLPVIGRLKPGVTVEQAQTEMHGIGTRLEQQYPSNRGFGVYVVGIQEQIVGSVQRGLLILLAAVGFVLLIACANLANLMLSRTSARRKELAVRTALGANRGRVMRQIVTETFVLALIGSAIGGVFAWWATRMFIALGGDSIPRQDSIAMDVRVLAFALILATVATLLSGIAPAMQASRRALVDHLREGARERIGGASRLRHALVAAQIALSLVLLTGAGLLIRTLWSMQRAERGFEPANVAMMTVGLPTTTYPGPPEARTFFARLTERIRALPGVTAVATGTGVLQPLVTNSGIFSIEGKPVPPPEQRVEYPVEVVSPGFFETVGMKIIRGRGFTDADHADAPRVIVINETFARIGWPGEDPIGRRIRAGDETSQAPWLTVVGIIADAHRSHVTRAIRPELYQSTLQVTPRTQTIMVRTAADPTAIVPAVRREVQALDPQLPLFNVTTLERELSLTLSQSRFQAVLLALFAAVSLLLATIGIYGVTSHAVSQRTQEVGVRIAMGARRTDVMRLMLVQHLRPAVAGLVVGVSGSFALSRFLQSLLFGVSATDPMTFASVALILLVAAVAACWVPARRATRVDPLVALRME